MRALPVCIVSAANYVPQLRPRAASLQGRRGALPRDGALTPSRAAWGAAWGRGSRGQLKGSRTVLPAPLSGPPLKGSVCLQGSP